MLDLERAFSLLERIDPQYKQYKQILNEADSRLKAVDRIIDQVFSNYFNPDDIVRSSEYYVNGNPNTTWRQYLLFNLRHTFGLMQNSDVKYLPLVARLAYSNEVRFDLTNDNGEQINTLRRIVNIFKKDDNLFNEVKNNPNITFGQLAEKFKETFAQEDAADAEAANSVQNNGSEYTVKEVPDFETAKYYGDRSCSDSKLCYTQSSSTWNSYTKNGLNRVYVCLRNGWENIPEEPTEGNPYDLYGTSMIFAFINPIGNLVTSNCRWNHANVDEYDGDVDHAFTKATLAQTIGMPFDSVFKAKDTWNNLISDIKKRLYNGEKPENIFEYCEYLQNGFALVSFEGMWNVIDKNYNFLYKEWFDCCEYFSEGFAVVQSNNKYNYITMNGDILYKEWFDECYSFSEGFGVVELDNKQNYITTNGKILCKEWFDKCYSFRNGFGVVELDNEYNYITTNGNILCKEWFDACYGFRNGFGVVAKNKQKNLIDSDGNILLKQWVESIRNDNNNGLIAFSDNENYYKFIPKEKRIEPITYEQFMEITDRPLRRRRRRVN